MRPILECGSWCWDPYREVQMNTSDHLHKKVAKFKNHIKDLVWENMAQKRKKTRICVVFKAYIGERAWKIIADTLKEPCYLSRHEHDRKIMVREQRTNIVNNALQKENHNQRE